jgi:protein-S-isoprenylcysteine O-methyltransferase Ste14
MAFDSLQNSTAARMIADLLGDLSDLVQKEIRLARAEVMDKISRRLEASIWFAVAGLLAFVVLLLVVEAIVFGLASLGLPLHWSCLVVAVVLAAIAGAAFYYGRASSRESLVPTRSVRQINEDLRTAKEQLS